MRRLNRFFLVGLFSFFLFVGSGLFVSAYFSSSVGFSGLPQTSSKNLCGTGPDFIVQVAPFGCVPVPVRSDALSQENFPVYCKLIATKISPLVSIKEIGGISISGNGHLNKEIEGIGFHPSRSALGVNEKIEHPIGNDIGYAVIVLKRQPNESALPSVVKGNFSLNLHYDVQDAFGIANSNLYLPVVNQQQWKSEQERFSFWNGKGYLRARVINPKEATIDIYSPAATSSGDKTRIFSTTLKVGASSRDISLPGFPSCNAHLKLRLDQIQAPDTTALIEVNGAEYQVAKGESFLNGACTLDTITKNGLSREVTGGCQTDNGLRDLNLKINPKISLKVKGVLKSYSVGDKLYVNQKEGYSVYLGYAGNYNNGVSNNLYITLFEKPGVADKMTPYEIYFESLYVKEFLNNLRQRSSLTGVLTSMGNTFGNLFGEITANFIGGYKTSLPIFQNEAGGEKILEAMKIFKFPISILMKSIDSKNIQVVGIAGPSNEKLSPSIQDNYNSALKSYSRALGYPDKSYPLNSEISLAEKAGIERINLSYNLNQKADVLKFCKSFKENFPDFSERTDISPEYKNILNVCDRKLDLSSESVSNENFIIRGSSNDFSLLNTYEPSIADYSVGVTVSRAKNNRVVAIYPSDSSIFLTGSDKLVVTNWGFEKISFNITNGVLNKKYSLEVNDFKSGKFKSVKFGKRIYFVSSSITGILRSLVVKIPYDISSVQPTVLGKGGILYLSGGDYITLKELTPTSAYFDITNVNEGASFSRRNILEVKLNEAGLFGSLGYRLSVNKINLKQVAKVSVLSNIQNTGTSTNVSFEIPIEKRSIHLTPEKIKSQIKTLNKTLKEFASLEKTTGTLVSGFKSACLATQAALMAKNFFSDMGGKGIARQSVMKGNDGWYTKCTGQIPTVYSTMEECLLKNSANIDKDVATYYKTLSKQNGEIKNLENKHVSSKTFLGQKVIGSGFKIAYAKSVQSELLSNLREIFSSTYPFLTEEKKINITAQINYLSSGKNLATMDEVRSLVLNSRIALDEKNQKQNSVLYVKTKADLVNTLKSIYLENEGTLKIDSLQEKLGGVSIVSCNNQLKGRERVLYTNGRTTFGQLNKNKKIKGGKIPDKDPIQICISSDGGIQLLDLEKGSSSVPYIVKGTYTLKASSGDQFTLTKYGSNSVLKNPMGINIMKVDENSYNNHYKGSVENPGKGPVLTYYESGVNKGLPAIVPFDSVHGWYAAIDNSPSLSGSIRSYDVSGKVNNFYLCNVGQNGLEQNKKPDDICEGIDLQTNFLQNNFPGLSSEEASKLVHEAIRAIEYASKLRQQHNGPLTGSQIIIADGIRTKVYVGKPAVQTPNVQCQDFMSPSDCNLLFNVCDPVICPASRCDLGGAYHVPNVIQSGIIGSIALCLPNAKEGIAVPVCLSGINAGLQGFHSILGSYRDCLQENLNTGKMVGVCDEIYSVYLCQMFWKQALPLTNVAIPSILSMTSGSAKGGGEYFGATNSWDQAKKSIDYFTQHYAEGSFRAFKFRNEQETGATVCKNFASVVYPTSVSSLKSFVQPDSPVQFSGGFSEVASQTVTNPPRSQYKVYYHIFAGKDSQAFYTVYLKGTFNEGSYYHTPSIRIINRSYIARGKSADVTDNFLAPSGYKQLCIDVNGQSKCGFKLVSTSFAVNEIKNEYLKQQATQKNIKSEKQCISGTASAYNLLNLNVQNGVQNTINPKIYNQGIRRVCASKNPGEGTDRNFGTKNQRWVDVGYCANENIKCWQDQDSVAKVISDSNIRNSALGTQSARVLKALEANGKGMSSETFTTEVNGIKNKEPSERINSITEVLKKVIREYQIGELYLLQGGAYSSLAKEAFKVQEIANRLRREATETKSTRGQSEKEKISSGNIGSKTFSGLQIKRGYKIKLSANYFSPVFEFQTGTVLSNSYYSYNRIDGWKWSQSKLSALSSWWKPVENFKGGISIPFNTLTSEDKKLIESLGNHPKNYRDGLGLFINKVKMGTSGLFSSKPTFVTTKNGVKVTYTSNGFFKVEQQSATPLWFEFKKNQWFWTKSTPPEETTSTRTLVSDFGFSTSEKYDGKKPVPANQKIIEALDGLNFTEGSIVLFNGGIGELTKEMSKLEINGGVSSEKIGSKITPVSKTLSSSQLAIGNRILNIVNIVKEGYSTEKKPWLLDSAVSAQTGAKTFGCMVLQVAMQESSLEHCSPVKESDPLYCDGNSDTVLKSYDGSSYGVMQINKGVHLNVHVYDFMQNVEAGIKLLINRYNFAPSSIIYENNYKKDQKAGWNSSLRSYNGWGIGGSPDTNYVKKVLEKQKIIADNFASCGNANSKSETSKTNIEGNKKTISNQGDKIILSATYKSPVFEFKNGKLLVSNLYYSYNITNGWEWSSKELSASSNEWNSVKNSQKKNPVLFGSLNQEEQNLMMRLSRVKYRLGLGFFIEKVKTGTSGLFSSKPTFVATKNGVKVTYSHNGFFKVEQQSATPLWFEYKNNQWSWTGSTPIKGNTPTRTLISDFGYSTPKGPNNLGSSIPNLGLKGALNGLNFTEGSIVLFNGGKSGLTEETREGIPNYKF